MVAFSRSLDLLVGTVYDHFVDFRKENEWNEVAHDVTMLTDGQMGVGTRFLGHYDRIGPMEYEIIATSGRTGPRSTVTRGIFRWVSTFSFTEQSGSTRVGCTMDPRPKGVLRAVRPLMTGMIEKQVNVGLASLEKTIQAKSAGSETVPDRHWAAWGSARRTACMGGPGEPRTRRDQSAHGALARGCLPQSSGAGHD